MATAVAKRAPSRSRRPVSGSRATLRVASAGSVAVPRVGGLGELGRRAVALPDTSLITGIARGRKWIFLLAALLLGIVALNVSLLKVNAHISQMSIMSQHVSEENARLRSKLAKLSSPERIIHAAQARGFVAPDATTIRYIHRYREPTLSQRRSVIGSAGFGG